MFQNRAVYFGLTTLALAGLAFAPAAHAQELLVANEGGATPTTYANTISEYNAATGAFTGTFLTLGSAGLADTGTTPVGLAEDSAGNIYVALNSNDTILKYNPTTGVSSTYATINDTLTSSQFGIGSPALAIYDNNLFVATVPTNSNSLNGGVFEVTPNAGGSTGTATKIFTDTSSTAQNIGGIAVDGSGNIYLGDGNAVSRVVELDSTGTQIAVRTHIPGGDSSSGTQGVTVGPDGTVYATAFKGDLASITDPFATGTLTVLASNSTIKGVNTTETDARPRGVIVDSGTGDLLVVDGTPTGAVDRFTTSGAAAGNGGYATFITAGLNGPTALLEYTAPVAAPEPSQMAVLGLGVLGLGVLGLRARRRSHVEA
jgi:sugar lactone lactonase YvrE